MWVVIAIIAIAVVAVVITTSLDRGSKISYTQFREYSNNYAYAVDADGDGNIDVTEDGNVTLNIVGEDGEITPKVVPAKEVIKRINIDQYSITAYAVNGSVYTLSARSFYSGDTTDIDRWADSGIMIEYTNPNSGSYWSSLITVGGLILLCVVFWLIIRSTAGGAGRTMK